MFSSAIGWFVRSYCDHPKHPCWVVCISLGLTPPWEVPRVGLMIGCVVGVQFVLLRTRQTDYNSDYHFTLIPATEGWCDVSASSSVFNAVIISPWSPPSSCSNMARGLAFRLLMASAADHCPLCPFSTEVSLHSSCLFSSWTVYCFAAKFLESF